MVLFNYRKPPESILRHHSLNGTDFFFFFFNIQTTYTWLKEIFASPLENKEEKKLEIKFCFNTRHEIDYHIVCGVVSKF